MCCCEYFFVFWFVMFCLMMFMLWCVVVSLLVVVVNLLKVDMNFFWLYFGVDDVCCVVVGVVVGGCVFVGVVFECGDGFLGGVEYVGELFGVCIMYLFDFCGEVGECVYVICEDFLLCFFGCVFDQFVDCCGFGSFLFFGDGGDFYGF